MNNGQAKYSVVRKIADGGMAEIYLARLEGARGFQKQVVLKRIRSALISDPHFRNMLIDEAHVAMGLNHGNIAQVLELGEADGHYFLAMELVDGWSLDQVIKRSRKADVPLPLELGLYVVVEVCRALSYAHNLTLQGQPMGIVHRDISPQNVLISDQGDVKLTDFGIAKARTNSEQTSRGVVKGKISYMSPEQASGGELDHRSDLYSLGIVLYSMATGRLPYEGGTPLEVMVRIQAGDFPPPDKVKPKLNGPLTQLILKAMELRPGDRFQSAEAMLIAAEKVLRNEFPHTGRTELKAFLDDLQERDGVPPISRATAEGSRDEKKEKDKDKKKKKKKTDEEETSDPIQVGSSMMLTTPEPIRQSSAKSAPPPLPRRSGEQPRQRRSRRTPVLMVVGAVAVALFVVLMLAPERATEPASSADPPATASATTAPAPTASATAAPATAAPATTAPATAAPATTAPASAAPATTAPEARAQEPVTSETAAAPGASPAPEDLSAAKDEGEDEDEERLLAEAVSDAGEVVIGEEDSTSDQPVETAEAEPAPVKAPAPPPAQRPAAPKEKVAAKAPAKPSPPPAAKAPDTVSVLITSQPTGAVVKLKKRVFGKTPIPLRFRTGIVFELTFVKNGFTPTNKRFLVTTRKDQKVVAHLAPARKRR